jgi:hypothetical protein
MTRPSAADGHIQAERDRAGSEEFARAGYHLAVEAADTLFDRGGISAGEYGRRCDAAAGRLDADLTRIAAEHRQALRALTPAAHRPARRLTAVA